jgi:hypothetical protein
MVIVDRSSEALISLAMPSAVLGGAFSGNVTSERSLAGILLRLLERFAAAGFSCPPESRQRPRFPFSSLRASMLGVKITSSSIFWPWPTLK